MLLPALLAVVLFGVMFVLVVLPPHAPKLEVDMECWNQQKSQLCLPSEQRVCVFSFDNRNPLPEPLQRLQDQNRAYCDRHGYDFKLFTTYPMDLPPYWVKVWLASDLLSQYDLIVWVDTDVVFHDQDIRVENILPLWNEGAFFFKSTDNHRWTSKFNAGIWGARNDERAHQFLQEWKSKYPADRWQKKNEGKWVCHHCVWAGDQYEQKSGERLLLSKEYSPHVLTLHWSILQEYRCETNEAFIFHFAGDIKHNMLKYIK